MKREDAILARRVRQYSDLVWGTLAFVIVIIAQGFLRIDFRQPLSISGDHFFLMILAKTLMSGDFWGTQTLGYPLGHSTVFFPDFEISLKAILLVFAELGFGPFFTIKAFIAVGLGLMAAASYACLRKLNIAGWLACIGSIVFVVSPYFVTRAVIHDFLSIYVTVPFGCTLALLVARCGSAGEMLRLLKSPFGILAAFVIATCGFYYAFFSVLFLGGASLIASFKARHIGPLACGAALSAAIFSVLLVAGLGPNLPSFLMGHWSQPIRTPVEQLYHGLSISDAIYTLQDVGAFSSHIARYISMRPRMLVGEGAGGWPGLVLTATILLCPLILLVRSSVGAAANNRSAVIELSAAFVVCGLLFASRGGIGYLFNDLVNPSIRAQARIMPFLSFFAIVIVCTFTQMLLARQRRWGAVAGVAIPILMLLAALPSTGTIRKVQKRTMADPVAMSMMSSTKAMLAAKDAHGLRAVLELPIQPWPEGANRNGLWTDNYALPFIFDRSKPPTKWSYGAAEVQDGFVEFRADMRGEYDPAGLPHRAVAKGFDGILIEKGALTTPEQSSLVMGMSLAPPCRIYDDAHYALFIINSTDCAGTTGSPSAVDFDFSHGNAREFLATGWGALEADGVWGLNRGSTLIVPAPAVAGDLEAKISFAIFRATPGTKTIRVSANGYSLDPITVGPADGAASASLIIPAQAISGSAMLRLDFEYLNPESPSSVGSADTRILGMFLKRLSLSAGALK